MARGESGPERPGRRGGRGGVRGTAIEEKKINQCLFVESPALAEGFILLLKESRKIIQGFMPDREVQTFEIKREDGKLRVFP